MAECATDVLVSFPESLHLYTGLLTVTTVCGGLSGILAAALLYVFCLKPLLLTRQVSIITSAESTVLIPYTLHSIFEMFVFSFVPSGLQCK